MLIFIKGAGDLATGVAWRLHNCGFQVVMTDIAGPPPCAAPSRFPARSMRARPRLKG